MNIAGNLSPCFGPGDLAVDVRAADVVHVNLPVIHIGFAGLGRLELRVDRHGGKLLEFGLPEGIEVSRARGGGLNFLRRDQGTAEGADLLCLRGANGDLGKEPAGFVKFGLKLPLAGGQSDFALGDFRHAAFLDGVSGFGDVGLLRLDIPADDLPGLVNALAVLGLHHEVLRAEIGGQQEEGEC